MRSPRVLPILAVTSLALVLATPRTSHAQVLQRFSIRAEGAGALLLGSPQSDQFGPGGSVIARLGVDVFGPLSVQASAGNWWFLANSGPVGRLYSFEGGLRLSPRLSPGVLGGPVIDANAGIGITGGLQRFTFNVGVGWEFHPTQWIALGPMVRYTQVLQPDSDAAPQDASIIQFGIGVSLRPPRSEPAAVVRVVSPPPAPPADSDHDGVIDSEDRCPTLPEDVDGFRDNDGCLDPDNDGDGIADAQDRCPDQAEVRNGFQDDDGCPDTLPTPPETVLEAHLREIGHRIFFDLGSHQLRGESQIGIRQMCEELRAHPTITRLRVEGHADESGAPERNQELSSFRAGIVARELIRCGFPPDRIEAVGLGAIRDCATQDDTCLQRNRRVEFHVNDPGAPPATP